MLIALQLGLKEAVASNPHKTYTQKSKKTDFAEVCYPKQVVVGPGVRRVEIVPNSWYEKQHAGIRIRRMAVVLFEDYALLQSYKNEPHVYGNFMIKIWKMFYIKFL